MLRLLQQIADLQVQNSPFFSEGTFPSFRENIIWQYRRPDDNMFVTASVLFILKELNLDLEVVKEMQTKFEPSLQLFQQKEGLKTYNFYRTKPSKHFPNGWVLHKLRQFKLPEDIDDTALAYLLLEPEKEQVLWLKEKLKLHANGAKLWIQNTLEHYKKLPVYSTWFGLKMPIEFDVCALCNLLLLFEKYDLPHNEHDLASIDFLCQVIERQEFMIAPLKVAQNYPRASLVLYHLARLMHKTKIDALEKHRASLIETTEKLLEIETNIYERRYLETAYMKLANKLPKETQTQLKVAYKPFFIAGFLSGFSNGLIKFLAQKTIFQISWRSEALDLALEVENKVLKARLMGEL